MGKEGNREKCWELIESSNSIILTTHVRPDGDGIASELALYKLLKNLKKRVYIINQDETPLMYRWLPNAEEIIVYSKVKDRKSITGADIDLSILLDCSSGKRIGKVRGLVERSKFVISLDHHEDSECYRDYCYVDTDASSIGELITDMVPGIWDTMDYDIAVCIYVSILTDTGSFSYSNTTSKVFNVAARLLSYGVKPEVAYRKVYNNKSLGYLKLLGKALNRLEAIENGKIVYLILPLSVYQETGATEEDNEGILEVIRSLRNMELIIMLRQLDNNRFKGSLRSETKVNCNYLAKIFGGGGHFKASGFVVEGDINTDGHIIINRIIEEVKKQGWV